jgi:DNA end-binding protein Ku
MKPIWKGYLKFSLVMIPIKMYNAVSKRRPVPFHLLHGECKTRIKQQNVCPTCDKTLTDEETIRGYEYGKDMYVIVTDEDIEKVRKESTEAIEIGKFIDQNQIQPIYYSDSHYLLPDGKVGVDAFALLHRAMLDTKKAALGKVVIRNRENLLSIQPCDGALIAYTLHYPEEVQSVEKIPEEEKVDKVEVDSGSLAMAKTLVQNMSGRFVPEEYRDEYAEALMKIIKAKAEGEEIRVEPRAERAKVISLMEALKKSVKETGTRAEVPKKAMATAGKRVKEAPAKRRKAS